MADDPTDLLTRLGRRPRLRISVGAVIVVLLVTVAAAVAISAASSAGAAQVVEVGGAAPHETGAPEGDRAARTQDGDEGGELFVHVLGAVRVPGLYQVAADARVVDAIAAAGGMADDADPAGVNLARRVADGEQLVVPRVGETPLAAAPPAPAAAIGAGPVSLGSATAEQLDTLPRIGPALAARIVAWREAGGRFQSVDDLLEVPGIGEATLEGLRDLVVP
ncbi:ComEA family DNA-binding protein [Amnibacterium flavum]|uniref:Competence protein ComEA n=1 Tax=Amnibacterium flavum TaxID=2173173 RepID=A0A2V1HNC3_9MICO|nr:ComEA family DNA-binding protein [Amnibacterium flavum]PVZ94096.1 competence protein ComEA [Amnibacterium flavum]